MYLLTCCSSGRITPIWLRERNCSSTTHWHLCSIAVRWFQNSIRRRRGEGKVWRIHILLVARLHNFGDLYVLEKILNKKKSCGPKIKMIIFTFILYRKNNRNWFSIFILRTNKQRFFFIFFDENKIFFAV
jgi:hypothetical protein